MITTLPPQTARPPKPSKSLAELDTKTSSAALAPDYRLLGLRPREARVEVIREAVHSAASQVQLENAASSLGQTDATSTESIGSDEQRLSQIAVAGYRLLDPRRRRTLFERVQLLITSEEEFDTTLKTMWASRPVAPPKVRIALKSSAKSSRRSLATSQDTTIQDDENQVALELFRDMRKHDRRALALWIGLASLTLSLATTLALFAYFA